MERRAALKLAPKHHWKTHTGNEHQLLQQAEPVSVTDQQLHQHRQAKQEEEECQLQDKDDEPVFAPEQSDIQDKEAWQQQHEFKQNEFEQTKSTEGHPWHRSDNASVKARLTLRQITSERGRWEQEPLSERCPTKVDQEGNRASDTEEEGSQEEGYWHSVEPNDDLE